MKNLAMKMAEDFKKYAELETKSAKAGDTDAATYWMNKKWKTSREAEQEGVNKDFSQALKDIGVY